MQARAVVTGAAGFIGSNLVEGLLDAGHEVVGIDAFVPYYDRTVKESNVATARLDPRFTFVEADLRTADLIPFLSGADVVVHLAAMPGLPRSWTEFDLYTECNLTATQRLLDAMVNAGVPRLIHGSTSSVYGAEASGDETLPLRPVSPYGVTKLAAEHTVSAYRRVFGLETVVLRYFSVYGPRQRPDMAYHRFIKALAAGDDLVVYGDGEQSRSNTFVGDCVTATLAAIEHGRDGEAYNIGGGNVMTVLQAIELIAGTMGVDARIRFEPARTGDQRHTSADTSKARRELRWGPAVAPADGIARQVAWHREYGLSVPARDVMTRDITAHSL